MDDRTNFLDKHLCSKLFSQILFKNKSFFNLHFIFLYQFICWKIMSNF